MNIEKILQERGQTHLLEYTKDFSAEEYATFARQVLSVDWELLKNTGEEVRKVGEISPITPLRLEEIEKRRAEFEAIGLRSIRRGEVGAVLLAGGQGTRLGVDGPKGAFDIGVTRNLYIFEQLIRNLQDVCALSGVVIPLFIMTSEKNDGQTRAFFEQREYFGYPEEFVYFFQQEMAPVVNEEGKLLFAERAKLAFSPNGNGGWFTSMMKGGLLAELKKLGVKWLNVFAVDNVLQRIADPVFVGATVASGANCGAKVVEKTCPEERVGALCLENGKPHVIEYYEISREMANARDEKGRLVYGSGVILNYLFSLERLQEVASEKIPVHLVKKKVRYLDENGNPVIPEKENGVQFETLILDMVKLMGSCLPFEVEREKEFAPVKNATGVDSVESARALLEKNGVSL